MYTECTSLSAGFDAAEQSDSDGTGENMAEHRLSISGRALASKQKYAAFNPLHAAAHTGMITEKELVIADIVQESVFVLFREQFTALCEKADAHQRRLGQLRSL